MKRLPKKFFEVLGTWEDDREPEEILRDIRAAAASGSDADAIHLLGLIAQAEADVRAGRTVSNEEVFAKLRARLERR